MNNGSLNLELLRLFNALIETGSVSKSAERLHICQPTASRSLERMRLLFNDRLFVKSGAGMVPTPRAQSLAAGMARALSEIEDLISGSEFAPADSERRFSIAAGSNVFGAIVPSLIERLADAAPKVRVELSIPDNELHARLRDGRVDLALCAGRIASADFFSTELFEESYCCVMRSGHPLAQRASVGAPPGLAALSAWPRVVALAQIDQRSYNLESCADAPLPPEQIRVHTHHILSAPFLLLDSDMIMVLPESTGRQLARRGLWTAVPPPWLAPRFPVQLAWHPRVHRDPAMSWLRNEIMAICSRA